MPATPFNFRFETDSYELDTLGHQDLRRLVNRLYALPDLKSMCLVLIGFSDPRGPFEYNQKLSLKRAKKVKKELESYGANPSIITVGFGEEPALLRDPRLYIENGELNLDGLQKNRRVEVWLER